MARGEVTSDIVMDPALGGSEGGVEASEEGVGDADGDADVGAGESFQDEWVGVEKLDFGEVIGLEKLHHLGRRQRVGRGGAPVHPHASRLVGVSGQEEEDGGG